MRYYRTIQKGYYFYLVSFTGTLQSASFGDVLNGKVMKQVIKAHKASIIIHNTNQVQLPTITSIVTRYHILEYLYHDLESAKKEYIQEIQKLKIQALKELTLINMALYNATDSEELFNKELLKLTGE